jgi:hypothetical protein
VLVGGSDDEAAVVVAPFDAPVSTTAGGRRGEGARWNGVSLTLGRHREATMNPSELVISGKVLRVVDGAAGPTLLPVQPGLWMVVAAVRRALEGVPSFRGLTTSRVRREYGHPEELIVSPAPHAGSDGVCRWLSRRRDSPRWYVGDALERGPNSHVLTDDSVLQRVARALQAVLPPVVPTEAERALVVSLGARWRDLQQEWRGVLDGAPLADWLERRAALEDDLDRNGVFGGVAEPRLVWACGDEIVRALAVAADARWRADELRVQDGLVHGSLGHGEAAGFSRVSLDLFVGESPPVHVLAALARAVPAQSEAQRGEVVAAVDGVRWRGRWRLERRCLRVIYAADLEASGGALAGAA